MTTMIEGVKEDGLNNINKEQDIMIRIKEQDIMNQNTEQGNTGSNETTRINHGSNNKGNVNRIVIFIMYVNVTKIVNPYRTMSVNIPQGNQEV